MHTVGYKEEKQKDRKNNGNIASSVLQLSNAKPTRSRHLVTNNDGGGLNLSVYPNYKEDSLAGQETIYDEHLLLDSRGLSKDGTELLLHA